MGIADRKLKHRENLKESILDAAKRLFVKDGYKATTIRKIAAEIEFSPTTIYLYYKDKADIMHALHQEGFKLLAQQLVTLGTVEHPFERLKAMGRIYIQFALAHREFYEIMFTLEEPMEHLCGGEKGESVWEEGDQAFQMLLSTINDCKQAGYFKDQEPNSFSLLVWSTMHGLCTLKNNGRLDMMGGEIGASGDDKELIQHVFEQFVKVLEKI